MKNHLYLTTTYFQFDIFFLNYKVTISLYSTSPKVGFTKPVIILAIVDLPEPDSPTKPSVSPSNISKETSLTALTTFSFIFFDYK